MAPHDILEDHAGKLVDLTGPTAEQFTGNQSFAQNETAIQIRELLDNFKGEPSLKRLFWQLLSYDRIREPLPVSLLPPSTREITESLEVFASTDSFTIIVAAVTSIPTDGRLEQIIWAVKRQIPNCVVLLNAPSGWTINYADERLKPAVRMLPIPGPLGRRSEIVNGLLALNAANDDSGQELSALELAQEVDASFPGATPSIGDFLTDFDRIAQHPDEEVRELWLLIREAGRYPLLTPAQERGEDLRGNESPPDGSSLPYQHWRLIVHNLRLVVWIARKWRGRGLEVADLVQHGSLGLMKAVVRFDPTRGYRFTTYAYWWVQQAITRAIFNEGNLIRWPVYRAPALIQAALEERRKGLQPGEKPPIGLPFILEIPSFRIVEPLDSIASAEISSAVMEMLERLSPKQREVICRRFGIGNDEPETLEEIGHDFDLTRERIRQIESKALGRLTHWRVTNKFRPYYDAAQWRISQEPFRIDPYNAHHLFGISTETSIAPLLNI
ncbi:MAG: RNA polymerase sigma factor RpoD/SigA [Acidobacteriaceae bacterium]